MKYAIEGDRLPMFSKVCSYCRRLHIGERTCAAFPKEIPEKIWLGENSHRSPVAGDNGIQFEAREVSRAAKAS